MSTKDQSNQTDAVDDASSASAKSSLRRNLTIHWPLSILFLTLIFSVTRDIVALEKRRDLVDRRNAQAAEMLKRYGKQTKFVDNLKFDLQKIAPTDAVAMKILTDFFPKPISPEPVKGTTEQNDK